MLWIGRQITALNIVKQLILPSLIACAIPALMDSYRYQGQRITAMPKLAGTGKEEKDGKIILFAGICFLIFVPVFKTLTHLPLFMGMLLALGFMWIITTIIHKSTEPEIAENLRLQKH